MDSQGENYKLKINIAHDGQFTEGILCEIHLPKRFADPIELIIKPTSEQEKHLGYPFEFSFSGESKGFSNERSTLRRKKTDPKGPWKNRER